jgi:putative DNA modification/repair radical SAM protein
MRIDNKLATLAAAAQFDVCGCGGSARSTASIDPTRFIHKAALPDGGCTSLFKVLQTNVCVNDCAYCVNQSRLDIPRMAFKPDELARLFMELYQKKMVQGIFLSSGIAGNPSGTMTRMIETIEILRRQYKFRDYVHLKLLPGAGMDCIEAACRLATRVSVNIEAPTASHLGRLSSKKNIYDGILEPMRWVKQFKSETGFVPSGQTTQFVVGAAGERDRDILNTTEALYREMELRRVYFAAYRPVGDPRLEGVSAASPWREHRLYQADWLLRIYKFTPGEVSLALDGGGNLSLKKNPKQAIAQKQPWLYPIDINKASYDELLRVPGIGPVSARRITQLRQIHDVSAVEQLQKLHVRYREAMPFIWFKGMLDWEKQMCLTPLFKEEESAETEDEPTLAQAVGVSPLSKGR